MKQNNVDTFIKDPRKALFTLSVPIVLGMTMQALYNVIDTAFVGRISAEAIAGLSFAFPVFFILIAINSGIGVGMGSRISRYMGEKKKKAAENAAMHGLLFSLLASVVLYLAGMLFLEDIFMVLGAEGVVLGHSLDYMSIILGSIFFLFPASVMSWIFTSQGDSKTAMIVTSSALFLNIILDPVFIFVLGMGVGGAALATGASWFCMLVVFVVLLRKRSYLQLRTGSFSFSAVIMKDIVRVGFPASLMMLLMSFSMMFINRFVAALGTDHVATLGIVFRMNGLAFMPVMGFAMGCMTLVGMFYGAGRFDLLKGIIWYAVRIGIAFTSAMSLILFIFPQYFLRIFTPDVGIIGMGVPFVRVIVWELPFAVASVFIARALQGMGFGLPGLIINSVRILLVAVPLIYVFLFVMGYGFLSVAVAFLIGAALSSLIAVVWIIIKLRKCGKGCR